MLDKLPAGLKKDLDKNLCTCMDVPKMDIIKSILNGATTLEEVKKHTYASMGAGCCIQQIEKLIKQLTPSEPGKRRRKRSK